MSLTDAAAAAAAGYKTGKIDDVPEAVFESFPPHGGLHAYVWWASKTTDAPVWFHIAAILAAGACELARRGWVVGHEQQIVPKFWTAMVAGPGVGKSTAINTAREFYTDACKRYGWADPYITTDGSTQGLFEAIARLHNKETDVTAAILIREEFSVLLNAKRRDDLSQTLCEWADGRYHERHTRGLQQAAAQGGTGGHATIKNAAISATFVTTERALLDVATPQHMEGGLFSRFDWVMGSARDIVAKMHHARRPEERAVALDLFFNWQKWLDVEDMRTTDGVVSPKIIEIGEDCTKYLESTLFVDYQQALKSDHALTASYKRAITHAYVIAGVFAMSSGRRVIQSSDIHRAVNLVNLCLDNLSRIAPEVGATPLMRAANRAFETIRQAGAIGVSKTPLYRRLQVPKRELDAILDTLEDEGSIKQLVDARDGKRGRPSMRFVAVGQQRFMSTPQDGQIIALDGAADTLEALDPEAHAR